MSQYSGNASTHLGNPSGSICNNVHDEDRKACYRHTPPGVCSPQNFSYDSFIEISKYHKSNDGTFDQAIRTHCGFGDLCSFI